MIKWKELLGYRYRQDGKTWVLEWNYCPTFGGYYKYFPTERDLTLFVREIAHGF